MKFHCSHLSRNNYLQILHKLHNIFFYLMITNFGRKLIYFSNLYIILLFVFFSWQLIPPKLIQIHLNLYTEMNRM